METKEAMAEELAQLERELRENSFFPLCQVDGCSRLAAYLNVHNETYECLECVSECWVSSMEPDPGDLVDAEGRVRYFVTVEPIEQLPVVTRINRIKLALGIPVWRRPWEYPELTVFTGKRTKKRKG